MDRMKANCDVKNRKVLKKTTLCVLLYCVKLRLLQAEGYCASMFAGVSCGQLLRSSFGSRRPSTTALRQSTAPYCFALPAEHVRAPGLLRGTLYRIVSMLQH